jgi:zinc protease
MGFLFLLVSVGLGFPIARDTLDNGLALLTFEDHHLPMVTMRFVIRAGSAADPADQDGVANLVGTLLTRGTMTRSATSLNQTIEYVGGRLSSGVDFDHTTVSIQALSKDLGLALDLLADMVLSPTFGDTELERARKEILGAIKRQADEPGDLITNEFYRRLFGRHPYGHPVIGYDSTVSGLGRAQTVEDYQRWFAPNNCYLVAAGDFDPAGLRAELARRFGGWARKPVPAIGDPELAPIARSEGTVIARPDMNQAYIFIGHYGIKEGAPDVFPVRLMNYRLGGAGTSARLGSAIREKRGLAYDARSYFDRRKLTGAFIASTETRTDSALASIEIMLAELKRMRDSGITRSELTFAKDYLLGNFPLDFQGLSDKVWLMDRIELYGMGLDYPDRFADRIGRVTQADVLKAAQDHIFPDRYVIVVVGNIAAEQLPVPGIEWLK